MKDLIDEWIVVRKREERAAKRLEKEREEEAEKERQVEMERKETEKALELAARSKKNEGWSWLPDRKIPKEVMTLDDLAYQYD